MTMTPTTSEQDRELLGDTPMVATSYGTQNPPFRMDAYYYSFEPTGVLAIDRILSAVACAGRAFHQTEDWREECGPYEPFMHGENAVDWIQNAANDAADAIRGCPRHHQRRKGMSQYTPEQMRAAFEDQMRSVWWGDSFHAERHPKAPDEYLKAPEQMAWVGWQAANAYAATPAAPADGDGKEGAR